MGWTRFKGAATVVAVASMALAGCGGAGADTGGDTNSAGDTSGIDEAYQAGVEGTFTEPPSSSSPGVEGKTIMIASCGQQNDNCVDLSAGAFKAAEILGWKTVLCDAKLDGSKFAECFRQAVVQKVDGIVNVAMDCAIIKSPLKETIKAGIRTVGVHAWDCDVTSPGEKPLFSDSISYGDRWADSSEAWRAWGAAEAAAALKMRDGKGSIIKPVNTEFASLKLLQEGWRAEVERLAPDTPVVDLPWTVGMAGPKLAAAVQAALLKTPDASVIDVDVNPDLGFTQGVSQAGKAGQVKPVGGHGSVSEVEQVRQGKIAALIGWPNDWWGFAAVDTLNSAFADRPQDDQGIGFAIIDAENNLPPEGEKYLGPESLDLAGAYAARWGK